MRKQLWSALVAGWALSLLWVATASAQEGPSGGRSYYNLGGAPGSDNAGVIPSGYQPPGYAAPGSMVPPQFEQYPSGPENAQATPEMPPLNPFPATSPYDYALDQTYNEDGLWFRRLKNGRRQFYTTLDFWGATLKAPSGTTIGEPVQSAGTAWEEANLLPQRFLEQFALNNYITTVTVSFNNLDQHIFNAPQNLQSLNPDLRRLGLRFAFGELNPDNTGMEIAGFVLVPREQGHTFNKGSIERSPDPTFSSTENAGGDPNAAVSIPNTGRLTFDEGFQVTYQSQAYGAEANMFGLTALNRDESIFLRSIIGFRYYGVSNSLNIYGQYSDLSGPLSIDFEPIAIPSLPPEQQPQPLRGINIDQFKYVPRSSFSLNSKAVSNLIGPQIGFQPEFGGKNFKVVSWAKFSPMVNLETVSVNTFNYGLPFTDGAQSAEFKKTNAHYSSLINAGALIQAPLFKYLPFVNTIPTIKDGTVRLGFDWIYTTDIARSEKSIRYYAPLPKVEVNRTEQALYGFFGGVGFTF